MKSKILLSLALVTLFMGGAVVQATPLTDAAAKGNLKQVESLLREGAISTRKMRAAIRH